MYRLPLIALVLALAAAPAFADRPPADALPLSEIVWMVEESGGLDYVKEVDWDDDGYWEIEYVREGGGEVTIDVDPRSGQIRD